MQLVETRNHVIYSFYSVYCEPTSSPKIGNMGKDIHTPSPALLGQWAPMLIYLFVVGIITPTANALIIGDYEYIARNYILQYFISVTTMVRVPSNDF